jgi:hypothetical protein
MSSTTAAAGKSNSSLGVMPMHTIRGVFKKYRTFGWQKYIY